MERPSTQVRLSGRPVTIVPLRAPPPPPPRVEHFTILTVEPRLSLVVPLVGSVAECGFPSPADDYLDRPLDFNELLIENAPATFVVRVAGDSMTGVGIFPGDLSVINRARRVARSKLATVVGVA